MYNSYETERRDNTRHEPINDNDDVELIVEGEVVPGIVGNISSGGICVIVLGAGGFEVGQEVIVRHCQHERQAVIRNTTLDAATMAYGLAWTDPSTGDEALGW